MSRSEPSYAPTDRAREMDGRILRQRAQRCCSTLTTRHDGSGSAHVSHTGGVIWRMRSQLAAQTGPRVGASSGVSHAAHAGASSTAINASAHVLMPSLETIAPPLFPKGFAADAQDPRRL